jgi:RNA polymerase sigma factor (sigma-70 family)
MTAGIAKGDPAAFDMFYDLWFDQALAIARRVSQRDEPTCLDLVQTAMLKAAKAMPVMRTEADLHRWLSRIIHNAAIDLFRAESRRRQRELGARENDRRHTDRLDERIAWLREELDKLGPDDRTLLRLRFYAGRSLEQAGDALGIERISDDDLARILRTAGSPYGLIVTDTGARVIPNRQQGL